MRQPVHEVSPELVLVDPELARRARAHLPSRDDWTIEFESRRPADEDASARPVSRVRPLHGLIAAIGLVLLLGAAALTASLLRDSPSETRLGAQAPAPHPAPAVRQPVQETGLRTAPHRGSVAAPPVRTKAPRPASPAAAPRPEPAPTSKPTRSSARPSPAPAANVRPTELMHLAIGRSAAWALSRLGPATAHTRQLQTCQLRWRPLGLTLYVKVGGPRQPCDQGVVVGGAQTARG